jgi:hypothetical protein
MPQSILPKMGLDGHTPTAIVYMPHHFSVIGLLDMVIEQSITHNTFLISHPRENSDTTNTKANFLEIYMVPVAPLNAN